MHKYRVWSCKSHTHPCIHMRVCAPTRPHTETGKPWFKTGKLSCGWEFAGSSCSAFKNTSKILILFVPIGLLKQQPKSLHFKKNWGLFQVCFLFSEMKMLWKKINHTGKGGKILSKPTARSWKENCSLLEWKRWGSAVRSPARKVQDAFVGWSRCQHELRPERTHRQWTKALLTLPVLPGNEGQLGQWKDQTGHG